MTDLTPKMESDASRDPNSNLQETEVEKIIKVIQKNMESNPQFKAQFQNLLLGGNLKPMAIENPAIQSSEIRTESSKNRNRSENLSYDDSESSSDSEKKENSENGKISLADKVKHDLANINSKLIKKKSITKKRWWTPEEVQFYCIFGVYFSFFFFLERGIRLIFRAFCLFFFGSTIIN